MRLLKRKTILFIFLGITVVFASLGSELPALLERIKSLFSPPVDVFVVKNLSFSDDDALEEWEEKVLKRRVDYRIEHEGGESFVHAVSEDTCSALYFKQKLNIKDYPVIGWKWRVNSFPKKKSPDAISSKGEDDFASRVYVIFPALFFSGSRSLEYIWAEDIPEGTIESSPWSRNIKLFVLRSGREDPQGWVEEKRDIFEDYVKAFGEEPDSNVGAIAIMTDSDSTSTTCDAYYDEFTFGYRAKKEKK